MTGLGASARPAPPIVHGERLEPCIPVRRAFFTHPPHHRGRLRYLSTALTAAFGLWLATPAVAQEPAPQRGGTIQYGHFQEPACLVHGWYLQRQFSDALVSRAADGKIWPWLATSWALSKDRKTYTFQIKPGVKFTDGTPLDAQAVAENFKRWTDADPAKRNGASFVYFSDNFESATATGPLTLRVTFKQPYQPFLTVLSHATHGILSSASLNRSAAETCEQPVGSGPFIVEKWNRGQNVVFKRNPHYNSAPGNAMRSTRGRPMWKAWSGNF
ncbi:MAG: ABC transporter substrate-binding protein [Burkholderiaceae bacterium]|nr:ABC transporter substrate-binding protein [Burkholderiaceae bacterium]